MDELEPVLSYTEMSYPLEPCVQEEPFGASCPRPWRVSLDKTTCIVHGLHTGLALTSTEAYELADSGKYKYVKTPMKDYVVYVADLVHFKQHLFEHDSQFTTGTSAEDVKLNIPKVLANPTDTLSTVSIARADEQQYIYFKECDECLILGEAKGQWITDVDSVHFYSKDDEAKYYSVYDIAPKYHEDENGDTIETIPPMLHGSLASKKQGIF